MKLLSAFAVLFLAGFVFAAYSVLSTDVTVEVREPFEISYALLGDGSNQWLGASNCGDTHITNHGGWISANGLTTLPVGYIYAGEERTLCVKVNNLSEAELAYGIDFKGSLAAAQMKVESVGTVVNSPVLGQSVSTSTVNLKVFDDAIPSDGDYTIQVEVTRG